MSACCSLPAGSESDKRLSDGDFRMLAVIARHGHLNPSRAALAELCGCSDSAAARRLKSLLAGGWIVCEARKTESGKVLANSYHVARPIAIEPVQWRTPSASEPRSPANSPTFSAEPEANSPTDSGGSLTDPRKIPPYDNNSTPLGSSSENSVDNLKGVQGDLLGEKPKPKTRRKPKIVQTEATMPTEPTPRMLAYATKFRFFNGTVLEMFGKWRRWHIDHASPIASHEQSWETWVEKQAQYRDRGNTQPSGYRKPSNGVTRNVLQG